jgi:saccharopine dehydrogenase-like NADP-dependent oxidoreductase
MKTILLFGAGKSASVLINYLLINAPKNDWKLLLADADQALALSKIGGSPRGEALCFNVLDESMRAAAVTKADLVISLLPPHLHIAVAKECITQKKHLLTASYLNDEIKEFSNEIAEKGLLFLYEMGLDPGIDHMSAMAMLDDIRKKGGQINSFISHCGGLVAPESDNNPWHYKISWNPRNVVTAGRDGAKFKLNGLLNQYSQQEIFDQVRTISIKDLGDYAWYPNRDSISYMGLYQLEAIPTFIRTTLRHPAYMRGWNYLLSFGMGKDEPVYEMDSPSLGEAWTQHFSSAKLSETVAQQCKKNPEFNEQLDFLGVHDTKTSLGKSRFSPAELLQISLEKKLCLLHSDKDMIIMQHEVEYSLEGHFFKAESTLIVKGEDAIQTAMAKTVGLPLGIAASMILQGKVNTRGLQIPTIPSIYVPVLEELRNEGICFSENCIEL